MKRLNKENLETLIKLTRFSSLILKQYFELIKNELEYNNAGKRKTIIDRLFILIDEENRIIDKYVTEDNCNILLDYLEKKGVVTDKIEEYFFIEENFFTIFKRIYNNILTRNVYLKNNKNILYSDFLKNLSQLYFAKILEEEATINQNHWKDFILNKYLIYYTNPSIENLTITNDFIANIDYPDFLEVVEDDLNSCNKSDIEKSLIVENIKALEELEDPYNLEALLNSMYLRCCFMLVEQEFAHEIIEKYLRLIGSDESKYTENQKLVIDAYLESKKDRYKYKKRYIHLDEMELELSKEEKMLDNLIDKAKNILKLYKKVIEIKNSDSIDEKELEKYVDFIQTLSENEYESYKKMFSGKEEEILELYCNLYEEVFGNESYSTIDRFHGLLMNEDTFPKIRVLALLETILNGGKDETDCVKLISLVNLIKLIEENEESKYSSLYKTHMISYLNPEIENLTICTNFSIINNYPDKIFINDKKDQSIKNTIAFDLIKEIIDNILNKSHKRDSNIKIKGLYFQSVLMLVDNSIINKIEREIISLINDIREKVIGDRCENCNKTVIYIADKEKIDSLLKKQCLAKYILVLINEFKNQKNNRENEKTYKKELNY